MTNIAVTGSHGFIGSALITALAQRGFAVQRLERNLLVAAARAELARHLQGCDAVVHCAGLTPRRGSRVTADDFDVANHQFTRNLGLAAADAGVPRLVFVSSISAIGRNDGVLTPDMPRNAIDAYGRSKADAEEALLAIDGLRSIIVRPPLVYGPGAKGDLSLLVRLCALPLPLPFGSVNNRRSMVGVTNLVDALCFLAAADIPDSASRILHVSDGDPLSLRELITIIRAGLGRAPNLLNVPPALLRRLLRAMGLQNLDRKLLGDLEVDISTLLALGWRPSVGPEFDLHRMAQGATGRRDGRPSNS